MLRRQIAKVISWQVDHHVLAEEDRTVYEYGYLLMVEVMINVVIAIVLGVAGSSLREVMLFLFLYIPLRSYCGGYHAETAGTCTLFSSIIIICEIIMVHIMPVHDNNLLSIVCGLFIICMVAVILLAPVDSVHKPLSKDVCSRHKKTVICIAFMHGVCMLGMLYFRVNIGCYIMTYVYSIQVLMLLLGRIKNMLIRTFWGE